MVTLRDSARGILSVSLCLVISGCSLSMEYTPYDKDPTADCSGLPEVWYDGIDQDCDGNDGDQDGDGFVPDAYVAAFPDWKTRHLVDVELREGDCWDDPDDGTFLDEAVLDGLTLTPDLVYPDAEDVWYDGVDQDCDGANDFDQDGDGFDSANDEQADGSVGDDCVDGSANDQIFEDTCSGELITIDPADAANFNPDATETYYDGIDQDCDGADDNDADGDGYAVCDECDDTDPETFPSDIPEIWYDCADQNCDGNDGDRDGDGYVDAAYTTYCTDWATINPGKQDGDCWDDITDIDPDFTAINSNPDLDHADVHPGAVDIPYDAVDAACDGDIFEFDVDQDGFDTDAYVNRDNVRGEDCHDDIAAANPDAYEECDADDIDHDCDGDLNDPGAAGCVTFYVDVDKDTYGITTSQCLCEAEGTYTASNNDDCDDTKSTINPGATEGVGDSVDSNCDGGESCYTDADNDGYRDSASTVLASSDTDCNDSGEATDDDGTGDCNDGNSAISPGDPEICDSSNTDEDCDGKADNDDLPSTGTTRYYKDADGDLYGATSDTGSLLCDASTTYKVTNYTDCNDSNSSINTAATEIAGDEVDQNCDNKETCYKDSDNDGYRPDSTSTVSSSDTDCVDSGEAKSSEPTTDCDDTLSTRSPGNNEVCDAANLDEDCDGLSDDNDSSTGSTSKTRYYKDADSDNYGDKSDSGSLLCDTTSTYKVTNNTDCNDASASINPGATEICDASNTDEDCDGLTDDNDSSVSSTGKTRYYKDADSDTYGDEDDSGSLHCDANSTYKVTNKTDCNDASASINSAATEVCDASNTDEDCDSLADDADSSTSSATKTTHYKDADSDTYGDKSDTGSSRCDANGTYKVTNKTDCNDSLSVINPGAQEICDAANTDEDCDGLADDTDGSVSSTAKTRYYIDADVDGEGDENDSGALSCDPTATYTATTKTDCDDGSAVVYAGRTNDICWNGIDNDCDSAIDEGSSSTPCYTGGELVISEIMYFPNAGGDPGGEWFEVYNPSTTNIVYMESMQITRLNAVSGDKEFVVADTIVVGTTDTVVFCYTDVSLGADCDYIYGSDQGLTSDLGVSYNTLFTMNNTNANTTLVITATSIDVSSDVELDSVNYDAGTPWPTYAAGYSIELKSSKLTSSFNDSGANWCKTTAVSYFTSGALKDYGTPNATNTCP